MQTWRRLATYLEPPSKKLWKAGGTHLAGGFGHVILDASERYVLSGVVVDAIGCLGGAVAWLAHAARVYYHLASDSHRVGEIDLVPRGAPGNRVKKGEGHM